MPNPIRWGVLGVAAITDRLLPAFGACPDAELVAVSSRNLARAQEAANRYGNCRAHGSYDDLLADPGVDAVYNPLPNHLHAEWTKKAADAGKHVLCEKPMAMTAAEAQSMADHCAAKNLRLLDGFMWPHHPRTKKLRETIAAGTIGPVQKVVAAFTFKMDEFDANAFRLQPEAGGGGLYDVGCYCVFATRMFMGAEPVKVVARAETFNGVDVDLTAILTFADGRTAHFDCGFAHPLRTRVEIVGTAGVIRVPNLWIPDDDATFEVARQSGDFGQAVEVITTPGHDQMACMLSEFAEAVRAGRDPVPGPNEAIKTAKVIDALLEAARTRREVGVA